jgi:hypothetical protein
LLLLSRGTFDKRSHGSEFEYGRELSSNNYAPLLTFQAMAMLPASPVKLQQNSAELKPFALKMLPWKVLNNYSKLHTHFKKFLLHSTFIDSRMMSSQPSQESQINIIRTTAPANFISPPRSNVPNPYFMNTYTGSQADLQD